MEAAFAALGIRPRLTLNEIDYYTAADVRRLRNHLAPKGKPNMGDPQTTSEMRKLAAENEAMRVRLKNTDGANRYIRRVDDFIARGYDKSEAVAMASRELPAGRKAFLKMTNSPIVHAGIDGKPKIVRRK